MTRIIHSFLAVMAVLFCFHPCAAETQREHIPYSLLISDAMPYKIRDHKLYHRETQIYPAAVSNAMIEESKLDPLKMIMDQLLTQHSNSASQSVSMPNYEMISFPSSSFSMVRIRGDKFQHLVWAHGPDHVRVSSHVFFSATESIRPSSVLAREFTTHFPVSDKAQIMMLQPYMLSLSFDATDILKVTLLCHYVEPGIEPFSKTYANFPQPVTHDMVSEMNFGYATHKQITTSPIRKQFKSASSVSCEMTLPNKSASRSIAVWTHVESPTSFMSFLYCRDSDSAIPDHTPEFFRYYEKP